MFCHVAHARRAIDSQIPQLFPSQSFPTAPSAHPMPSSKPTGIGEDRKLQMAGWHERKQMAKFAKHGLKYEKGKQLVKALREAQTKTITAHVETVTERQTQDLKRHLDEAVAAVEKSRGHVRCG